jgi:signal transduction histidine kinase
VSDGRLATSRGIRAGIFGRIEAGKRSYLFQRVSCLQLARPSSADFQQEAGSAGYEISCGGDEGIEVSADAEACGRALRNLLENAVKYSPHHKNIDVRVNRVQGHARLPSSIRGIGVAPAERTAIFTQVPSGAEARTRGIAGTGIGPRHGRSHRQGAPRAR